MLEKFIDHDCAEMIQLISSSFYVLYKRPSGVVFLENRAAVQETKGTHAEDATPAAKEHGPGCPSTVRKAII